ncbi:hypothetical protein [Rhizobium binxianense]|uniref:hypothetical protein n=1 Tax=Rhizobium binxianense TaxID=3024242 RepID=UPI0023626D9C|nr:hypothetical protein [Rhizobium sp. MJ37]MDC7743602.1 hypothetical protein [Rhizobium sp. BC56]MDC9809916.1 hypothetical protein [Rhizobium sp. MC62]MDC9832767.1 hypothetical protein [Rhizobium sp. MJ37]
MSLSSSYGLFLAGPFLRAQPLNLYAGFDNRLVVGITIAERRQHGAFRSPKR